KERLQSELSECKDEEKRRELQERLKEYDEESETLERLQEIMVCIIIIQLCEDHVRTGLESLGGKVST
ncbi:hypothetical protein GBAR_LOCUS20341, partial [Geodia barretti]